MKLYSVRDRLLDFLAPPFVAPSDFQVMQALANTVNQGKDTDAYKAAPHHFELYRLAEIDEQGNVTPGKTFLCDLASLVRTGIREESGRGPGGSPRQSYPGGHPGETGGT